MAKNVAITVTYLVESCFSMMGSRDRQKQLWSYRVNLDKRVRSDHPLRKFNELLKLDFVREEVANFYGTKGNVSEDPAVIIKMMLLLFLDNVRSERELMRIIPERLDYMWCLGYGLDDAIPNHSVLSKARKRARRQANTRRAKLDRKRRQHLVERSFADAANRHGFKRARWRGLVKQSIQNLLIATIQNLRKLVATVQNLPAKVWEALTYILSWSSLTLHALSPHLHRVA